MQAILAVTVPFFALVLAGYGTMQLGRWALSHRGGRRFGDHLIFGRTFQQLPVAGTDHGMVVDQQDTDHGCFSSGQRALDSALDQARWEPFTKKARASITRASCH